MSSFFNNDELHQIGFKEIGDNVMLSRKASIYGASHISLGSNIRIDDFCILSGNITISNFVHVAAYTALYGSQAGIVIEDFANISSRICIYAVCDDYSGETMTNPLIPDRLKHVQNAPTRICRHVIIGSGSTVLQGVTLGEGVAVGAMSLVKDSLEPWGIYAGIPCRRIKDRAKGVLELEKEFLAQRNK
ncbi:MAG: acyltransferase [Eubacteriales bacterium]|nr:acyltransferase [Eubacteriales bacterium]